MQISIHSSKYQSSLETSVNNELKELQENGKKIVDVKISSNDRVYFVMILYQ